MGFLVIVVVLAAVGAGVAYKLGMLNQYLPPNMHYVPPQAASENPASTATAKAQ